MTCEVRCPWCGSEMHSVLEFIRSKSGKDIAWNCHMQCTNWECQAEGPFMQVPASVEKEEANKIIRAATLRRYDPSYKPMTKEELEEYDDIFPVWVEATEPSMSNTWIIPEHIGCMLEYIGQRYDKTWRCWSRKPTDAEMAACRWER